jgi:hypothetical protein
MVEKNKRFVYGTFNWFSKPQKTTLPPPLARALKLPEKIRDRVAVEIVREYGPNELIGKIYTKGTANNWIPLEPSEAEEIDWFKSYKMFSANVRTAPKMYYFDMEGSGHWAVLHFRNESDDIGPYVAVALRYSE